MPWIDHTGAMAVEICVDTNVLVYAHRREAAEHDRALIHDARIAAICVAHGFERLLSRDRDFSLLPELTTQDPF